MLKWFYLLLVKTIAFIVKYQNNIEPEEIPRFMVLWVAIAGPLLLALLLWAENTTYTSARLIFKQALSTLFVLVVWLQPAALSIYGRWILAGLILSWVGDLLLVFSASKVFLVGLVSFLLAHVCYAAAFFKYGAFHIWLSAGIVTAVLVGFIIFFWLRPHLGNMKIPVIIYSVVITVMVVSAMAFFTNFNHLSAGRWSILVGAIVFYISDITVARDRFVAPGFDNRLYGLPLYYIAQFLFAFSVAQI